MLLSSYCCILLFSYLSDSVHYSLNSLIKLGNLSLAPHLYPTHPHPPPPSAQKCPVSPPCWSSEGVFQCQSSCQSQLRFCSAEKLQLICPHSTTFLYLFLSSCAAINRSALQEVRWSALLYPALIRIKYTSFRPNRCFPNLFWVADTPQPRWEIFSRTSPSWLIGRYLHN